jgi:dTMP kinase
MSKLLTLNALDGSGKSTQLELIKNYLKSKGTKFDFYHFPTYGDNEFSNIISQYLRGEFGDVNNVDPYFVANIYAMDRYLFKPKLEKMLQENDIVILDRYVHCNMAFQGAKFNVYSDENMKIQRWIYDFEFNFLKLPYPDTCIFLDVPLDILKQRLESKREGSDREYLKGKEDIHEKDFGLQKRVYYNYKNMDSDDYIKIDCTNKDGKLLTPDEVFNKYKIHIDNLL